MAGPQLACTSCQTRSMFRLYLGQHKFGPSQTHISYIYEKWILINVLPCTIPSRSFEHADYIVIKKCIVFPLDVIGVNEHYSSTPESVEVAAIVRLIEPWPDCNRNSIKNNE